MKTSSKIQVIFPSDSLLDFDELLGALRTHYGVGYAGLFCSGTSNTSNPSAKLLLQTLRVKSCMAPGKIEKICRPYVRGQADVTPFRSFNNVTEGWKLLEERGQFRAWGGRRCSSKQAKSKPKKSRRATLYLHINALGKEDVGHITAKDLDNLVGTEDDVVGFFERNYTANAKRAIMTREWEKFRVYSREKIRTWDHQQSGGGLCDRYGIPTEECGYSSDSETEDEFVDAPVDQHLERLPEPPVYDPDSDSEGNIERKRRLLRAKLVDRAPKIRKDDFLKEFECLILENPHNSNVVASTRDGYFKYFDGKRWIKAYNKDFFEKVTLNRISKATEMLNKQPLLSCRDFTRSQVSAMVTRLLRFGEGSEADVFLRDNTEAVKDGVLASENQEFRLGLAERALKRSITRVGENDVRGGRVVRTTTWQKLKA